MTEQKVFVETRTKTGNGRRVQCGFYRPARFSWAMRELTRATQEDPTWDRTCGHLIQRFAQLL